MNKTYRTVLGRVINAMEITSLPRNEKLVYEIWEAMKRFHAEPKYRCQVTEAVESD